ncbi:MAG: flagellar hook-length control protein FliK, partial [Planctomycetota bacterium]
GTPLSGSSPPGAPGAAVPPLPAPPPAGAAGSAAPPAAGTGEPARSASVLLAEDSSPPWGADPARLEEAAEVLRQLRAHLAPSRRQVLVSLSPPELGRVAIQVSLLRGRLRTVVRAESPATLELLQSQSPALFAMLAEEGIRAEDFELELGRPGDFAAARRDARDPRLGAEIRPRRVSPVLPPGAPRPGGRAAELAGEDHIDTYA